VAKLHILTGYEQKSGVKNGVFLLKNERKREFLDEKRVFGDERGG
jgi:hypothetical protein